jgi:lipid IVA palmitoyltransferase
MYFACNRFPRRVAFCAALGLCLTVAANADEDPAASSPAATAPVPATSTADGGSMWDKAKATIETTWASDQYELYIPLHTWHNRRAYDANKIAEYNENPWGLGAGKYRYDEQGNWHALYAMAFLDSHNRLEPIAGYGYEKIWRPAEGWRLGAGFTAGVTARQDYNYVPLPLVLPLLSVEYKRFSLQTTYVPGGHNNGNVLFTWARWQL